MRTFSFKLTASLLVLGSAVVPAAAEDNKFYPGTMCLGSASLNTRIERPTTGRAINAGPGGFTFQCPIVKDDNDIARARVAVIDDSPIDNVDCALRTRHLGGTLSVRTAATGVAAHGSDPEELTFVDLNADDGFAYYILSCVVPAPYVGTDGTVFKSGIVAYHVTEND
jgi:hypothetical protein